MVMSSLWGYLCLYSISLCPSIIPINIPDYFSVRRTCYTGNQHKKPNQTLPLLKILLGLELWKHSFPHKSAK